MKVKAIARFALLTALALVLGYAEQWFPIAPGIPGIKLGLANTVLLYAVYMAGPAQAALLMAAKVVLSGFLFAGFSAMLYSLAGGVLSLAVMLALRRLPRLGVIGVSACGAVAHNVGQLTVAFLMLGVGTVWAYLPVLILSGAVMGPITGYVAHRVFCALEKTGANLSVSPRSLKQTKAWDIGCIAILLAITGGIWMGMNNAGLNLSRAGKDIAQAGAPEYYVLVTQNGETRYAIPATDYGTYTIVNRYTDGENTFVIDEDGVHMETANCPDKVCIHQGIIRPGGIFPISCLPNLLVLQVVPWNEIPGGFDLNAQDSTAIRDSG